MGLVLGEQVGGWQVAQGASRHYCRDRGDECPGSL
jgi:hypothetical protein